MNKESGRFLSRAKKEIDAKFSGNSFTEMMRKEAEANLVTKGVLKR